MRRAPSPFEPLSMPGPPPCGPHGACIMLWRANGSTTRSGCEVARRSPMADPPPKPERDWKPAPVDPVLEPPVERLPSRARPPMSRVWIARVLALAVDAVQIVFMPMFGEGIVSPFNDVLDVIVGLAMVWLVGW